MNSQFLEDILPLVQHPSHYLGSEINAIKKNDNKAKLRIALAFPDLYAVGMSYLGMQILYHVLNSQKDVVAERVFAPAVDLEAELRAKQMPLCSLETRTPLGHFDIIGFSLLYELNFTNILGMLDLSEVPFFARQRGPSHPFVIAGGPCTFNPEPMAEFFDAMVVGDGEEVSVKLAKMWMAWKDGGGDREALLKAWSQVPGVYIPAFFEPHWDDKGLQALTPRFAAYSSVSKAVVSDLSRSAFPKKPIVPYGKPVHERLSLEVCRGCTRGCRFCQAGMIYRPVRERSPDKLLSLAQEGLAGTGYEDISLLSLSTGDYGPLEAVMEQLMQWCEPRKIAVSLPSLRVDSLSESLMNQIKRVRKTGFTIAPEAGSQRLRDVINKNVTEQALVETLAKAFGLGWRLVKLYFMIGLPTETDEDVADIVRMVRRLQKIRVPGSTQRDIAVSVSTFIPKAHTPFQWCQQISLAESREKIHILRDALRGKGLRFKWQNPEMSVIEGLWARGDRRLSRLLVKAYELGCRFDGWSEHFQFTRWQEAMQASDLDLGCLGKARDLSEPLAWDHIHSGISKTFLRQEWEKALAAQSTEDCRHGQCHQCGVCDFQTVAPVTFQSEQCDKWHHRVKPLVPADGFARFKISYEKLGRARFFGHLEMVKILMRAFRRAGISLRFSLGFHPAPKVSFGPALPVGMESIEEHFFVETSDLVEPLILVESVNKELPEGLRLTGCQVDPKTSKANLNGLCQYLVELKGQAFSENRLKAFRSRSEWFLEKRNKKGRVTRVDLKAAVVALHIVSPRTVRMVLDGASGNQVRPAEVLESIFSLSQRSLRVAAIQKQPFSIQGTTGAVT